MSSKHYTSLFAWLRDVFRGDPVREQYERVEAAIRAQATAAADSESDRVLADFYTDRTNNIDPYAGPDEAQDFADAMCKRYAHSRDWAANKKRADEAAARVEAEKARLASLQEKNDD